MPEILPFSAACERNKDVILDVINPYLQTAEAVLEIGTGTAQHAIHFARAHPGLVWQTSDQAQYLDGIRAQLNHTQLDNVLPPFQLDVNQPQWGEGVSLYSLVFTANTFHIMTWSDVQAFFKGLHQVINDTATLIVYGPFKYGGAFTSESNVAFDQSLRSRGCGSAIRDFEAVNELAEGIGFKLLADHKMPANNQCVVWQRDE